MKTIKLTETNNYRVQGRTTAERDPPKAAIHLPVPDGAGSSQSTPEPDPLKLKRSEMVTMLP